MNKTRAITLDDLDRRLLALLQQDTAVTAESLGSKIGLSASSVQRRIKRLRAFYSSNNHIVRNYRIIMR